VSDQLADLRRVGEGTCSEIAVKLAMSEKSMATGSTRGRRYFRV